MDVNSSFEVCNSFLRTCLLDIPMAGKDIPCDYFTVLVKNGAKFKSKSLESIELQKTLAQVAEDTGIGTESIDIYASEKEICDTPTRVKD